MKCALVDLSSEIIDAMYYPNEMIIKFSENIYNDVELVGGKEAY